MAHTFFVMKRVGHPDRLLVWDTRTLSIGRAKENDIVVPENEISRRHVIFKKEGNRFGVGDYQTGNGTFVNGQRIAGTELHPLRSGDVVEIASLLRLEFYDGDEHPAKRGIKLEYASHLKTVGMMPAGANPNATMLGLADSLPAADEDFVIERSGRDHDEAELALDFIAPPAKEHAPFELEFDEEPAFESGGKTTTQPAAKAARPAAKTAARSAPKPVAPDPGESQSGDAIDRMRRLKLLHAEGLITDSEFERKRAKILEEI